MSRWLSWQPKNFKSSDELGPSEPTKPGFDGFVGSIPEQNPKIEGTSLQSEEPRNAWEWIEERAAIMEFLGNIDHETANARAFEIWFRRFVDATPQTASNEAI